MTLSDQLKNGNAFPHIKVPAELLKKELQRLCEQTFGAGAEVIKLQRLTGGANAATWSFSYADQALILRQKIDGASDNQDSLMAIPLSMEAKLIRTAQEQGVAVPKIYATSEPSSELGESILMSKEDGEGLPQRIYKDPKYENAIAKLEDQCAEALAKIHATDLTAIRDGLTTKDPSDALQQLASRYLEYGGNNEVISAAIGWMRKNCPQPTEHVLVHSDFRMGNLLIDEQGISAVLDWELAHIGDPLFDIAHLCAPPWRFGRYDKVVGGFGDLDNFVELYQQHSGRHVNLQRLQWWRVLASVNWSVICMVMANMWRTNSDRELERIVIGTRVSESEIDLMLMFDEIIGREQTFSSPKKDNAVDGSTSVDTQPSELASALQEWISKDIIPTTNGREAFKAKVAKNAAGILLRHAEQGSYFKHQQKQRRTDLGYALGPLCQQLENSKLDLSNDELREHLTLTAYERVLLDQPNYAGLKVAKERWNL